MTCCASRPLFPRQCLRDDRVVLAPPERPVAAAVIAIVHFRNRDTVVAIAPRSGIVPGHQRTFRKFIAGDLLQHASPVTVIYPGNVQPGIMAPLQVSFDRSNGLYCSKSMNVNLDIDRVQASRPARRPLLLHGRSGPSSSPGTHLASFISSPGPGQK